MIGINRIKCPTCGHMSNFKSDRKYGYCSHCGTRIFLDTPINVTPTKTIDTPMTLEEYISKGKELIKNNNHAKLKELAITMVGKWHHNFYPYCFLAISETGIDIIDDLPFNNHMMSKFEINDDIKSRIYHLARYKYVSSTQNVFNTLSKYYPDVPSTETQKAWRKAPTSYEERLLTLSKYKSAINVIEEKYLQNMRELAKNDEEYAILSGYLKWVQNVEDGLKELQKYNEKANEFVQEDFKNTPRPGNKIVFSLYLIFAVLSLSLLFLSTSSLVLGFVLGFSSIFSKIGFFVCASFIAGITLYFIFRKKLFSSGHVISALMILIASIIVITLGATGTLNPQPDNVLIIFFFITSIVVSTLGSIISIIIACNNRIVDTQKNKTYIGNLEALLTNNFNVDFNYKFENLK